MFLAQMLMDIMHLRMAEHSDGAISPARRRGAAVGGEPVAAVPTNTNHNAHCRAARFFATILLPAPIGRP